MQGLGSIIKLGAKLASSATAAFRGVDPEIDQTKESIMATSAVRRQLDREADQAYW